MTWPRILHRVWLDEEERPEFLEWKERLQELHPDWEIRTWNDSSKLGWMRHHDLMQELLKTDPFGRAPDLLRYELLWQYGGCYIDTDFEPLRRFDELFEDPRPFAAWESDRTMCTALLAAPPRHPAIGVLLDGVEERLEQTKGKPANEAIGPEYATALWRERDDVRRLPPRTFYPVGWWEKHFLGRIDYPSDTFAVHWWNKGWGSSRPRVEVRGSNQGVSILVPFRDSDGTRSQPWSFVRERLERLYPEAELIVASDDGEDPFHKTLALNRAAAAAKGEILILYDADMLVSIDVLKEVVEVVRANPMAWGQPYNQKIKLNEAGTQAIYDAGADWDGTLRWRDFGKPESQTTFKAAPPLVVSRQAWEIVGGMDERFSRGWGQEDVAFARALEVLCGRPLRQPSAEAFHLFHNRIGVSGNDLWPGQTAEDKRYHIWLQAQYQRARTPDQMRKLLEERDGGNGLHDRVGDRSQADRPVPTLIVR